MKGFSLCPCFRALSFVRFEIRGAEAAFLSQRLQGHKSVPTLSNASPFTQCDWGCWHPWYFPTPLHYGTLKESKTKGMLKQLCTCNISIRYIIAENRLNALYYLYKQKGTFYWGNSSHAAPSCSSCLGVVALPFTQCRITGLSGLPKVTLRAPVLLVVGMKKGLKHYVANNQYCSRLMICSFFLNHNFAMAVTR